jgi:hypothetical protein
MSNTESAAIRMLRFAGRGIDRILLKAVCINFPMEILNQKTNEFCEGKVIQLKTDLNLRGITISDIDQF